MFLDRIPLHNNIKPQPAQQATFSLDPFIGFLQTSGSDEASSNTITQFLLDMARQLEHTYGTPNEKNISHFTALFNSVRYLQQPLAAAASDVWAIGTALADQAVYGTSAFAELTNAGLQPYTTSYAHGEEFDFENRLLYMLLLERCYAVPKPSVPLLFSYGKDGITQYVELEIDYTFVEVEPIGDLPILDLSAFRDKEISSLDDLQPLLRTLDPQQFSFRGFSILRYVDRNQELIKERLQTLIGNLHGYELPDFFQALQDVLVTALGSRDVRSSFFPVLELNGFPVLKSDFSKDSIFFSDLIAREREQCESGIFAFIKNPYTIAFGVEEGLDTQEPFLINLLQEAALSSYICIPLKHNKNLVGFLELYTRAPHKLDKYSLLKIKPFFSYLAQLAYELLIIFKQRIDQVILKNYTALQPAVQWRFNQVAASYLGRSSAGDQQAQLEPVRFKDVYPVYGAVDIKDSTKLRNAVQRDDALRRINSFAQLIDVMPAQDSPHVVALKTKVGKFKKLLSSIRIDKILAEIQYFLYQEIPYLLSIDMSRITPDMKAAMAEMGLNEVDGRYVVEERDDDFEVSLQLMNRMIKAELDNLNEFVQATFPSYFETFRTDGIEYDMYVGQSITPTQVFDDTMLRKIRKQQIITMANIAKKATQLRDSLPVPLQTTQLIFVHPHEINVSFRLDEKRFDVDGGYNVRYQVIKKRIDKVCVLGSNERLVQPDTIAIVYTSDVIALELEEMITELISEGVVQPDVVYLPLEDIQDVIELQAVRLHLQK